MDCNCGSQICILRSDKSFNQYSDIQQTSYEAEQSGVCLCCSDFKKFRENVVTSRKIDHSVEPRKHKCRLVKKMIGMKYAIKEILKINNSMFSKHSELETAFDKEVVKNLKIVELLTKNLHEITALNKTIQKMKTLDTDKNREIKQLKKLNKQLKLAIIDDDDKDSLDDDIDEQIECGNISNRSDLSYIDDTANTDDPLDIILTYQSIKDYLTNSNQSLSTLCYNNNIFGTEKNKIFSEFLDKKLKRIDICHPEVKESLKNDYELIEAILKK